MNELRSIAPPLAVALVLLALPASALAQTDIVDEASVLSLAARSSPTLAAAMLERERASRLVLGEEARYGFVLGADGTLNIGETPSLTIGRVQQSYNEQVVLGVDLSRAFEWGMNVELRAAGARQFRRAVFVPTMPMPVEVGPGYAFDVTLTVTQSLLRGGWERNGLAQLRAARVDRDRASASRDRAASEVARDVLGSYWELWYARAALEVEIETRALAERQLAEARQRHEIGTASAADILSFATRLASSDEAIASAEGELRRRAIELGRVIGGEQGELAPGDAPPDLPALRDDAVIAIAIERAPEIAELSAQVRSAQEQLDVAGAALEPRLDVTGQLGVHGMGYDDVSQAFDQFGRFAAVTGMVSLEFEMPLDDTQHRAEIERARLAVEVAQRQLDAARDRIRAETQRLLETARVARRRVQLAEETVRIAGELADAEQQRYELGASTPTAVLEAQRELRGARLRLLRAQIDLVVSDVQMSHVLGELLGRMPME
jgi:outer membrane protein TolC